MPSTFDLGTVFGPLITEDRLVMEQGKSHPSRLWNMGTTCSKACLVLPLVFQQVKGAAGHTTKGFKFHTKSRDLGLAHPSLFKPQENLIREYFRLGTLDCKDVSIFSLLLATHGADSEREPD